MIAALHIEPTLLFLLVTLLLLAYLVQDVGGLLLLLLQGGLLKNYCDQTNEKVAVHLVLNVVRLQPTKVLANRLLCIADESVPSRAKFMLSSRANKLCSLIVSDSFMAELNYFSNSNSSSLLYSSSTGMNRAR